MFEDNSKNITAISDFESQISFRHSRFRSATHSASLNFIYKYKDCQNFEFFAVYNCYKLCWYRTWMAAEHFKTKFLLVLLILFYFLIFLLLFFHTDVFTDLNYYSIFERMTEIWSECKLPSVKMGDVLYRILTLLNLEKLSAFLLLNRTLNFFLYIHTYIYNII